MNQSTKTLFVLFIGLLLSTNASFSNDSREPFFLFHDFAFEKGFLLGPLDSSQGWKTHAVLPWGKEGNQPIWRLCQWGTKFDLAKEKCESLQGDVVYRNPAKQVLHGGPDSDRRDLILEIGGSAEYGDRPRRAGEAWPHLLIEQDAVVVHPLSALAALRLTIQLRLLSFRDHLKSDFDSGLHAAQFQLFLVIKNIQPQSSNFNDFFWFGVPFFDNRHDIPPAYMARDVGKGDATGKFIYTVDGATFNTNPMKRGQWVAIECDLLPHIQEGLKQAVVKGYLQDSDPKNYSVVNMNMGWEIPGTYDASIQIRDFSLVGMMKQ